MHLCFMFNTFTLLNCQVVLDLTERNVKYCALGGGARGGGSERKDITQSHDQCNAKGR